MADLTRKMENSFTVIGFIDIDSYECQLWQRDHPEFYGKPCVVANTSGRIVSVTHEAKALGVNRTATPQLRQAKQLVPNLKVFSKPDVWGKQDSKKTRDGTWELFSCIRDYCKKLGADVIIELASSDEIFLDISTEVNKGMMLKQQGKGWKNSIQISENTVLELYDKKKPGPFNHWITWEPIERNWVYHVRREVDSLVFGALFMRELCLHVWRNTRLASSAGVASNKLLAKVGCGLNKPGKITILTEGSWKRVAANLPLRSIPGLGGQTGQKLKEKFESLNTVFDLMKLRLPDLVKFDPEMAPKISSWAHGKDNQPVVPKVRDRIKLNKAGGDIRSIGNLSKTLRNLTLEIQSYLLDEKERYERTTDKIQMQLSICIPDGSKEAQATSISEEFDISKPEGFSSILTSALCLVEGLPNFDEKKFTITELNFVAKDFYPLDGLENGFLRNFDLMKLPGPKSRLRVHIKQNADTMNFPTFNCHNFIGSFRTTANQLFSTENLTLPELQPLAHIKQLIGGKLETGYTDPAECTMIKDHNAYYELKHAHFIQWLRETKFMEKVKMGDFKTPNFIAFGGRISDPLRTPASVIYGDWQIYGINVGNIVYLWDQKKPQNPDVQSSYGTYFEKLVTSTADHVNEFEKIYVVNEVTLGLHQLLVVNEIDAITETGEWTEVNLRIRSKPEATMAKNLRTWSQSIVPGVKNFLIGTRSFDGIVLDVKMTTMEEVSALLGEKPAACTEFMNRLLSFIRDHLPTSDEKKVKKFSWVCGHLDVVSEDIQENMIPNLVFPRLYSAYLKEINKYDETQ